MLVTYVLLAVLFTYVSWRTAGIEAAMGMHVANNLVFVGGGLLRGDNLVAVQSDVTAQILPLLAQLVLGLVVALAVVRLARREDPALR
ncbi:MAG: hypothetical protein LWW86_15335 [Micrococcales bacterium]|nr:hypothetical protein [Micrococcales bacterium]